MLIFLQATEILREADKASDKYGLTTVLLVCFCILLLLAVWKVILPLFKDAQAKYDSAMKEHLQEQKEQAKEFLTALRGIEDSHKEVTKDIMSKLKSRQGQQ